MPSLDGPRHCGFVDALISRSNPAELTARRNLSIAQAVAAEVASTDGRSIPPSSIPKELEVRPRQAADATGENHDLLM